MGSATRSANDVSKKSIKSDLARIDRMTDAEIDYSDIPALDKSFFTVPVTRIPRATAGAANKRPTPQRKIQHASRKT